MARRSGGSDFKFPKKYVISLGKYPKASLEGWAALVDVAGLLSGRGADAIRRVVIARCAATSCMSTMLRQFRQFT
jgi:hypothetical protein